MFYQVSQDLHMTLPISQALAASIPRPVLQSLMGTLLACSRALCPTILEMLRHDRDVGFRIVDSLYDAGDVDHRRLESSPLVDN